MGRLILCKHNILNGYAVPFAETKLVIGMSIVVQIVTTYRKAIYRCVACAYTLNSPGDSKEFTMKIKIEIDESLQEDEVLIRCRGLTDEVTQIQKSVSDVVNAGQKYVFYKRNDRVLSAAG